MMSDIDVFCKQKKNNVFVIIELIQKNIQCFLDYEILIYCGIDGLCDVMMYKELYMEVFKLVKFLVYKGI